jgi:hypothetical protein
MQYLCYDKKYELLEEVAKETYLTLKKFRCYSYY